MASELNVFSIIISVLMILIGFLLNRIFTEIDKLRTTDVDLIGSINMLRVALPTAYLEKSEFLRHETEERALSLAMRSDMTLHYERLDRTINTQLEALSKRLLAASELRRKADAEGTA